VIEAVKVTNPPNTSGVVNYTGLSSGTFTNTETLTGSTSGTATLVGQIDDGGGAGRLFFSGVTGTFVGTLSTTTGGATGATAGTHTATESEVFWEDTDAEYHILIKDVYLWGQGAMNQSAVYMQAHDDSSLSFEEGELFRAQAGSGAPAHIECAGGDLNMTLVDFPQTRDVFLKKTAANPNMSFTDCSFNEDTGIWASNTFLENSVTGGSITMLRCTHDLPSKKQNLLTLFASATPTVLRDIAIDVRGCAINTQASSDAQTGLGSVMSVPQDVTAEAELQKTFIDNTIYGGNVALLKMADATRTAIKNLTMQHNYFYQDVAGQKMFEFGPSIGTAITTETNFPENFLVEWNKFHMVDRGVVVTYTVAAGTISIGETVTWNGGTDSAVVIAKDGTTIGLKSWTSEPDNADVLDNGASGTVNVDDPILNYQDPGNEVWDSHRAKNFTLQYNWIWSGGEDGFEFHSMQDNNTVRYCGAGHNGNTDLGLHGQLVDFFHAENADDSSIGNTIHDIWGKCGGEAVSITELNDVVVSNILVENHEAVLGTPPTAQIPVSLCLTDNVGGESTFTGKMSVDAQCAGSDQVAGTGTNAETFSKAPAEVP
jgi:hypothetical protein